MLSLSFIIFRGHNNVRHSFSFIFSPFRLMINPSPAITYRACPIITFRHFPAAPIWVLVSLIMTYRLI